MDGDESSVDTSVTRGAGIASGLVRTVAEAMGTGPYDVPVLNDIVDPDALNALFDPATATADSPTVVVALEIDDTVATVESDGTITVPGRTTDVADALGAVDDATEVTVTHDWDGPQSLLSTVVSAVTAATDADPVAARDAIDARLDRNALNALFRSRGNGVSRGEGGLRVPFREYDIVIHSDGVVTIQPTLTRINRTGGNLLVVGSVPHEVGETISRDLLGSAPDRARIVAVHGHDVESAFDRLDDVGAAPSRSVVIDHGDASRSAAAMDATSRRPSVRAGGGDLDALAAELLDAVATLASASDGFSPGQLRVCLDSLGSIRSQYDGDAVADFLETVTDGVRRVSGIGHYVMLTDRTSEHVRAVEDLFDVVVELRVGADGAEQRWHIRETGYTTDWFRVGVTDIEP